MKFAKGENTLYLLDFDFLYLRTQRRTSSVDANYDILDIMDDLLSNFGDIDEDEEYSGESRYTLHPSGTLLIRESQKNMKFGNPESQKS